MRNSRLTRGFTLIELLVALVVTSILLAAISTLAFALNSASKATAETSSVQARVRVATLQVQELIRNCSLICFTGDEDMAIWTFDKNADGKINIDELAFLERGANRDHLHLCTFLGAGDSEIALSSIQAVSTGWWSAYCKDTDYTGLLPECRNVEFSFDRLPPESGFVSISFDMSDNDTVRHYQINAALRSRKGNLLDESGTIISDDD